VQLELLVLLVPPELLVYRVQLAPLDYKAVWVQPVLLGHKEIQGPAVHKVMLAQLGLQDRKVIWVPLALQDLRAMQVRQVQVALRVILVQPDLKVMSVLQDLRVMLVLLDLKVMSVLLVLLDLKVMWAQLAQLVLG